jgi:hypothetical protein
VTTLYYPEFITSRMSVVRMGMGQATVNSIEHPYLSHSRLYILAEHSINTMTAPFIPPPIDSGIAPLPVSSLPSIPSLTGSEPVVEANTTPVIPGQPRPVVPAEEIGVVPAKALDPVAGGPGLLEKAREIGMPVSPSRAIASER